MLLTLWSDAGGGSGSAAASPASGYLAGRARAARLLLSFEGSRAPTSSERAPGVIDRSDLRTLLKIGFWHHHVENPMKNNGF